MAALLDIDIFDDTATVTWTHDGITEIVTKVELDWQPEERDVGVSAGFNIHGELPQELHDIVARKAMEHYDDYDDGECY